MGQDSTIDIHIHDTYFVITHSLIYWLFAFIVWFLWILYMLTGKILYSKSLIWVHVIITLFTVMCLLLVLLLGNNIFDPQPWQYIDLSSGILSNEYNTNSRLTIYSIIALIVGQIAFVINIVTGLLKRLKKLQNA